MTQKDKETIIAKIERRMVELAKDKYIDLHDTLCRTKEMKHLLDFISSLPTDDYPMPEDTVIFQRGVAEGRRLEREEMKEESEDGDERIRKWIIKVIEQEGFRYLDQTYDQENALAWLEKQKETITSKTKDYTIANDYTSAYYEERGYKNGYADGVRDTKAAIAKSPVEQKPAEWSEEDERHRKNILAFFSGIEKTSPYYEDYVWFKSLRPSWKPSEEQMEALKECGGCKNEIKSLYNDLKKL